MRRTIVLVGLGAVASFAMMAASMTLFTPGRVLAQVAGHSVDHFSAHSQALPPEIVALAQLPANQRFQHFKGGQVQFTDASNVARTLTATPGTVMSLQGDNLVVAPNDVSLGTSKSYALSAQTVIRRHAQSWTGGQPRGQIAVNDKVIVIALDGEPPRAVLVAGPEGFGRPGHGFGPGR